MTPEELENLYEEVTDLIYNYRSYHVWYTYGNKFVSPNGSISFDVYGFSDQGEGAEWTEYWSIDTNGKIYTSENVYDNIEEFKKDW